MSQAHKYPVRAAAHQFGPDAVVSLEHDYLWIGTGSRCFGYIDDLRTLRRIHARLGVVLAKRTKRLRRARG